MRRLRLGLFVGAGLGVFRGLVPSGRLLYFSPKMVYAPAMHMTTRHGCLAERGWMPRAWTPDRRGTRRRSAMRIARSMGRPRVTCSVTGVSRRFTFVALCGLKGCSDCFGGGCLAAGVASPALADAPDPSRGSRALFVTASPGGNGRSRSKGSGNGRRRRNARRTGTARAIRWRGSMATRPTRTARANHRTASSMSVTASTTP